MIVTRAQWPLFCMILFAGMLGCGSDSDDPTTGSPKHATAPASAKYPQLTFPDDAAKIAEQLALSAKPGQAGEMVLTATRVNAPVRLTLRAGTRLLPVDRKEAPPFVTSTQTSFDIARAGAESVVGVAYEHPDHWGKHSSHDAYRLTELHAQSELVAFLNAAGTDEKKVSWSSRQIGVWIILENIPVKTLFNKNVVYSNSFAGPEASLVTRIYSYRTVKKLVPLLESVGLKPDDYQIFTDIEDAFAKVRASYQLANWSDTLRRGSIGNTFSGFDDYSDEPQVIELLMAYIKNHTNPYYRESAANYLIDIGALKQSNDELFALVNDDQQHTLLRYAAAGTLYRRQDPRGMPLVLAFELEQELIADLKGSIGDSITHASQENRRPDESYSDWYERTGGWSRLEKSGIDVKNIQAIVSRIRTELSENVSALLKAISTTDTKALYKALGMYPQRYRQNDAMRDWITTLAQTHPDKNMRVAALQKLVYFKGSDFHDLIVDRIEHDESRDVKFRALRVPWPKSADKRRSILTVAMACPEDSVRIEAISLVDQDMFDEQVAALLVKVAEADPALQARESAMELLVKFQSPLVGPVLKSAMADQELKNQEQVIRALRLYVQHDPGASGLATVKQITAEHTQSKVRSFAMMMLKDYALNGMDVWDFVMQRMEQDSDEHVQANAVHLASQCLKRMKDLPSAHRVIQMGFSSSGAQARRRAIDVTQAFKLTDHVSTLVELAKTDPVDQVRLAAYSALGKFKSPDLFDILVTWSQSPDDAMRQLAVQQLTRQFADHPKTRSVLEPMSEDKNTSIKRDVARFLDPK